MLNEKRTKRRLDQTLASLGYGSRSSVRDAIEEGRVRIGARVADDPGEKVHPGELHFDDAPLDHPDGLLIRYHKPVGLVCSHDQREGPRIYDALPTRWLDRNPVPTSIGRLDKDTSGILLVTDLMPLVHRLTSPRNKVEKVYRVTLDKACPRHLPELFAQGGLVLEGERDPCAPAELRIGEGNACELVLIEGRNRQVRRMFAAFGCEVLQLHRTRFGPWTVDDLQPGAYQDVDPASFGP